MNITTRKSNRRGGPLPWLAAVAVAAGISLAGPSSYAASTAADDGRKVTDAPAQAEPGFVARERAAALPPLRPATRATLQALAQRVRAYVAAHGTTYSFAGYADPVSGQVTLESDAPPAVVSRLRDGQGRGSADIRTFRATVSDTFHRCDDIPPFYGGGCLSSSAFAGVTVCSTGYAVKNAVGTRFLVTAGHCFPNGTIVKTGTGLNTVGSVSGNAMPAKDMALIGGRPYAGRVFTGGGLSGASAPVVAAGNAVVGFANYCHSGGGTGEQCGHTATSTAAFICTASGCKGPLVRFTGGVLPALADSGAPFYAKDAGGGIWIRGHVIAVGGGAGYAEPWSKVASTYGVSIVL